MLCILNSATLIPPDRSYVVHYSSEASRGMGQYHFNNAHYEFVLFLGGTMYCDIGPDQYILSPAPGYPCMAIMDMNVPHMHTYDPLRAHTMYHVLFNDDYLAQFKQATGVELLRELVPPCVTKLDMSGADGLPEKCLQSIVYNKSGACETAINTQALHLFFLQVCSAPKQFLSPGKTEGSEKTVFEIIEYINQHCGEPLSLAAVAQAFSFSKEHLARLFRKRTSMTVNQYILRARMLQARALLLRGDPIAQTADNTGFSSPSYFIRCFKEYYGETPGNYQRTQFTEGGEGIDAVGKTAKKRG